MILFRTRNASLSAIFLQLKIVFYNFKSLSIKNESMNFTQFLLYCIEIYLS